MIDIGSLVRYKNHPEMAIVIDHWIEDKSGGVHTVVKWLNGYYVETISAFGTMNTR